MKLRKVIAMTCGATILAASLAACGSSGSSASGSSAKAETTAKAAETSTVTEGTQAADEETFKIDLATAYAADAPAGVALAKFVEDVKTASGGSIDISLFTDGTLGSAGDNYAAVASGDLDMTMAGLEGLDLYAPEYTFLDAPFLMQSVEQQEAILNSGIGDKLKQIYEDNGFVTLGFHNRDVRVLAANKEVKTPDDVKGLKLRLPGMTVYVDTWSKLGVSSTTVAMSELYTALQTKVAEACEGGYEQMTTLKLYEVQKNIMETNHVYEFVGLYIHKDLYDRMSDNQKKILQDCAEEDLKYADELAEKNREEYKQQCLDGGMTLTEVDTDAFRAALEDYYKEQFSSKWTSTTYDEVMSYAK